MLRTTNADDPNLLTSQQVIERLLTDNRLRRLALTCVLPAVRCGHEWRFRRDDLDDWIRRQGRPVSAPSC